MISLSHRTHRHTRRYAILVALLLLAGTTASAAPDGISSSAGPMLEEGQRLFQRASNTDEEARALDLYRKAVDRFEFAVEEGGIYNGRLFYNIGNGYYRLGDLGKAILYYRRAALLRPADPNIQHNLEQARANRADRLPSSEEASAARVLFFWHYYLSPRLRAYLFVLSFGAAWILGGLYLLNKRRGRLSGAVASGLVAVLMLSSILVHEQSLRNDAEGVITAQEVVARKGDGTAYEPSFVDPLHAGTEFTILETRVDWLRIELPDGRTTWIPSEAGEVIGNVRGGG
jgi:hypothetical protein